MNEQDILKQETLYFLVPYEDGGTLCRATKHKDGGWNLYELYRGEWCFDDNISDTSILRRCEEGQLLLPCQLK